MMEFSSLIWAAPILIIAAVIISYTLNHSENTARLNITVAVVSFLLSLSVIIERYNFEHADYGYYFDWFVLDNFYYRIGYEINHTTAYFLVVVTGLNIVFLLMHRQYESQRNKQAYANINLICGLLSAIVISDNVLTYYIISFCISVALFLKLATLNVVGMLHTLRAFSKSFIIGHLLFLCALMLIFYHQPNHAVEFTVIDSNLAIHTNLLNMDEQWVIGLLLVLSTIFISTVLVPFERQLHDQPLLHMVSIYIIVFIRLLMPAYMLIRFDSIIRIDDLIETIVIILGALLLIINCIKLLKQTSVAHIFLHMSNVMLGMLYLMFGLQAKLMLSALVLVYLFVYVLLFLLIIISHQRVLFQIIKGIVGITMLLPLVMCISTSNHYSLNMLNITFLNIMVWIALIMYSLTIFISIARLKRHKFVDGYTVFKMNNVTYWFMYLVSVIMAIAVSFSWFHEFSVDERAQFVFEFNVQFLINILILCLCIGIGLASARFLYQLNRSAKPFKRDDNETGWSIVTATKNLFMNAVHKIEETWNKVWESKLPYLFKKGEVYIASIQPNIVSKIIMMWVIGIVISILLVIIRG